MSRNFETVFPQLLLSLTLLFAGVPPSFGAKAPSSGIDQRHATEEVAKAPSEASADDGSTNPTNPPPGNLREGGTMSTNEFRLSLIVLSFGVVVVLCEFLLLRKRVLSGADVLRIFSVTLIIIGTFFIVTAGFSSQQIAPAMGLLGTIAGYLLGQRSAENLSSTLSDAREDNKSGSS